MALNSVNTNTGAMIALQNLNKTNSALETTENRINTGLKVSSAKDDGATWAIAQSMRSKSTSLDAVKDSLSRGQSTIDVALSASDSVSDLLTQMKSKALSASDASLDSTARAALNEDFKSLRDQITKAIGNADFNGVNLIDGSTSSIASLANSDGSSRLTVQGQDMSLGGSILTLAATASFSSATTASALLASLDSSITNLSTAQASLGTGSNALSAHATFVQALQDSLDTGVGNLVDADLSKESANLTALQTKQQLGIQALSIANSSTSGLLSLFR